jgi:hypothetical protein
MQEEHEAAVAYLHAHGLDVGVSTDMLDDMVQLAVERLESAAHRGPEYELADSELLVLREGGFDLSGRTLGRADPVAQGVADYAAVLQTALSTKEAADKLGVNASRIRQRLGEGTLYGIRINSEWRLPLFQFVDGGLLPGFDEVVSRIDREEVHPVALYRWLTSPNPDLYAEDVEIELSPQQWLASGRRVEPVARMASHL